MADFDPRDIVTLNLKYGTGATPRKVLAFSELCAKVLFASQKSLKPEKLRNRIATALGVQRIAEPPVQQGLSLLESLGKAARRGQRWELTAPAREAIRQEIDRSHEDVSGVLRRHFPADLDQVVLTRWFKEAGASVFGQYGDEWVASVCRGTRQGALKLKPIGRLLAPATRKHKLQDQAGKLEAGFLAFLRSEDLVDQAHLMALGQAMFSARLVAADIGADPITLEEFRGATVILDTNLVFAITLEDHRVGKSVGALARALQQIQAKAVFLRPTRDEYERAVMGVRRQVLSMLDAFPLDLILDAQSDVVSTARSRGCKSREDYERFFDALGQFPTTVASGTPLSLLEDQEVARSIGAGEVDIRLKQRIRGLAAQLRPDWRRREKRESSLQHDASLIHVTEDERSRQSKCWVLSLDRSLQACAVERAGPHAMPTVLSVDALVEILAVEGAGPTVNPTDFAPLLARIIVNECAPPPSTYTIEDLQWLYTINEGVAELPATDAKDIVAIVAKARVEGAKVTDTQLQLRVNRALQVKREATEQRLRDAQARAQGAEQEVAEERRSRRALEEELVGHKTKEFRKQALIQLLRRLSWRVPGAVLCGITVWIIAQWLVSGIAIKQAIVNLSGFLGLAVGTWRFIWAPVRQYNAEVKAAEKRARNHVYGGTEREVSE
jgi:hypothetical protein